MSKAYCCCDTVHLVNSLAVAVVSKTPQPALVAGTTVYLETVPLALPVTAMSHRWSRVVPAHAHMWLPCCVDEVCCYALAPPRKVILGSCQQHVLCEQPKWTSRKHIRHASTRRHRVCFSWCGKSIVDSSP
ncbi:uncharacterized protein SPSK_08120 [Sporothrix schenckii 1099-18]|uniref:Uncharacterized protein n=1 Tax=Sporothrix schenckii 1099-18 TaxID=1397361 RepID=A0A0F2MHD4_SPOSC|nr:uncharacterized protein SPSK_08120 [Sporothrix schenckii 1099-18]KJR88459.1 hypothetical protein SPSK_08120 [Sporothrix schenckii 1099-18]